jgi:GINS complex subunit 4
MDIDDIIAELDHDLGNRDEEDLRELTRLWIAERGAPELMTWPELLVKRITDRIARQVLLLSLLSVFVHSDGLPLDRSC